MMNKVKQRMGKIVNVELSTSNQREMAREVPSLLVGEGQDGGAYISEAVRIKGDFASDLPLIQRRN
jgi:hypothetical protein